MVEEFTKKPLYIERKSILDLGVVILGNKNLPKKDEMYYLYLTSDQWRLSVFWRLALLLSRSTAHFSAIILNLGQNVGLLNLTEELKVAVKLFRQLRTAAGKFRRVDLDGNRKWLAMQINIRLLGVVSGSSHFSLSSKILPHRQIKSTVRLCRRIKNSETSDTNIWPK